MDSNLTDLNKDPPAATNATAEAARTEEPVGPYLLFAAYTHLSSQYYFQISAVTSIV